jgi:hypothetical protein
MNIFITYNWYTFKAVLKEDINEVSIFGSPSAS